MRKLKVLLPFIIVSFTFCKGGAKNNSAISPKLSYDTARIAIIPSMDSTYTPSTLTQEEIVEIEKIFLQSINEHDSAIAGTDRKYYSVGDQSNYKRQYVCYLNKNGEKIVYVNCFCNSGNKDWHKEMIVVEDGGSCYFNLTINLSTKKYFDFIVNGDA